MYLSDLSASLQTPALPVSPAPVSILDTFVITSDTDIPTCKDTMDNDLLPPATSQSPQAGHYSH